MAETASRQIVVLAAWAVWIAGLGSARATPPEMTFAGGQLTIKTDRYEVQWRQGCLTGARTLLGVPAALTVDRPSMSVEQLPNGLGSFSGHLAEGRAQHAPWNSVPLGTKFPAQHPVCPATRVRYERLPDGARLIYTGLCDAAEAVLTQELTVDAATGDLVVRQRVASGRPGVFGIAMSLLNLRPEINWAMPYFGGQRWRAEDGRNQITTLAWARFWSAGFAIGELPRSGSFIVWADDPGLHAKYFRRLNGRDVQAVGFEACADAPYDSRQYTAFAWRFNTFAGDWMDAAERYKRWMIGAYRLVPRRQRPSRWVDDVALIWPAAPNPQAMEAMARLFDPKKILLHNWGMLRGFNRRVPEYIPADPHYAELVARAHRLGYRVGAYTSMLLVDQEAFPDMMRQYGLQYTYDGLTRDKPAAEKGWLAEVHPGSSAWREFYSARMAEVQQKYGVDYLYQDVAGGGLGSSGEIEGRTLSQGVVACEEAIRARAPRAALGGEYWTEINACREDFGVASFLAWGNERHKRQISSPENLHPVLSYLFSDFCLYWPHNIPTRDPRRFHPSMNMDEVLGALPVWNTTTDDRTSEARLVLERARLWAEGFRPYFPRPWDRAVRAYMRSPDGRIVKYQAQQGGTLCLETTGQGDRLRYGRITGLQRYAGSTPVNIDGWNAYDARGPIGLDTAAWYCIFPGGPTGLSVTLTGLPAGAVVRGVRITDQYCLDEIDGTGRGRITWQAAGPWGQIVTAGQTLPSGATSAELQLPAALLLAKHPAPELPLDKLLPLEHWPAFLVCRGQILRPGKVLRAGKFTIDNVSHTGTMVFPPMGGKDSELSVEKLVALPPGRGLTLELSSGRLGGPSDGVHLVVRVNGREIWRQYRDDRRGWKDAAIDLGAYAGQSVVLSFALDCGPGGANLSCDETIWGDPRLVLTAGRVR